MKQHPSAHAQAETRDLRPFQLVLTVIAALAIAVLALSQRLSAQPAILPGELPGRPVYQQAAPQAEAPAAHLPQGRCDLQFEKITDQIQQQNLVRRLTGHWTEEVRSYRRQADGTYDSVGYAFLPEQSRFGPVVYKYANFDVSPSLQSVSEPAYDTVSFGRGTLTDNLRGYRLVELHSSTDPMRCDQFAFEIWQGKLHIVRGLTQSGGRVVALEQETLGKASDTGRVDLIPFAGRLPRSNAPQAAQPVEQPVAAPPANDTALPTH